MKFLRYLTEIIEIICFIGIVRRLLLLSLGMRNRPAILKPWKKSEGHSLSLSESLGFGYKGKQIDIYYTEGVSVMKSDEILSEGHQCCIICSHLQSKMFKSLRCLRILRGIEARLKLPLGGPLDEPKNVDLFFTKRNKRLIVFLKPTFSHYFLVVLPSVGFVRRLLLPSLGRRTRPTILKPWKTFMATFETWKNEILG